jgi:predicted O-linked N-acetylglucosamine transferase (SPINDLY family)
VKPFERFFRRRPPASKSPENAATGREEERDAGPGRALREALQHHQEGRLEEAERLYRRALETDPDNIDALHFLGVIAYQRGDYDGAADLILRALSLNSSNAPAHNNLGNVYAAQDRTDEALASYGKAIALAPDYVDARVNLGGILVRQNRLEDAAACYGDLLALAPDRLDTHMDLGAILLRQGKREEAAACYRRAVSLKPDFVEAQVNLGNVLREQRLFDEAVECYKKAIQAQPGLAVAHLNLGNVLRDLARTDDAISSLQAAVAADPRLLDAWISLGDALTGEDRRVEAVDCYKRALALDPEYAEVRWAFTMSQIPAVYEAGADPARFRSAFSHSLDELDRWFDPARVGRGFKAVGVQQPFCLAYQEENNRDLLERYGRLCTRIMANWYQREGFPAPAKRSPGGVVRVGIVSDHFRNHSVWHALTKGWFEELDRGRFAVHAFHLGSNSDEETSFARAHASHFEEGKAGLRQWVETILASRLDVLLYPEIGMDPMTARLASLRLAPVQAASWGHPETTGLPTVDYYLSAEDFEPDNAQDHYTERLVPLPALGCFYRPARVEHLIPELDALGIRDDASCLLLCPGVPFKYAPRYDWVFPEIARRLGSCKFVFFTHNKRNLSERLHHRLRVAFESSGLDSERFVAFVPWLNRPAFYGLMKIARAYLDTIGFSGFNTAMQAMECGLPLVTREGRYMRGRLASGILRRIGLAELVAASEQQYIERVVRLARDDDYHLRVRRRIEECRDRAFADRAPLRALERFLEGAISR